MMTVCIDDSDRKLLKTGALYTIDPGDAQETAVIAAVGTPGATSLNAAVAAGSISLPVASALGFRPGETITIDSGAQAETAVIAGVGRRGPPTITLSAPLKLAHAAGTEASGTGITLSTPLTRQHAAGATVSDGAPTPGAPNRYQK